MNIKKKSYFILIVIIVYVVAIISYAQEEKATGKRQREFVFFKGQTTSIKDPFELRDPFKREFQKLKSRATKDASTWGLDGKYSNVPTIGEVSLSKIRIVGVLLGQERRAVIKVEGQNETFILKEGMKLGPDQAEIKAILPGGIVLVEKIRNVYDKDEYLETVVPISAE